MSFLLGSNIGALADTHVHGRIGRAGGTVDQVLSYKGCDVEDINIPDGGFGAVVHPGRLKTLRDVTSDILKTERFSDNVVLFRNVLSPEFRRRYPRQIAAFEG